MSIEMEQKYRKAVESQWEEVFFDSCTNDWQDKWHIDGEKAIVMNTPIGMEFHAGPDWMDNASHSVLWLKDYFVGDFKIEFDYTRLDDEKRTSVNILYMHATGIEEGPYTKDIFEWSNLRKVPAMATYFQNMKLYHISYAAYDENSDPREYIRARRYMGRDLGNTNFTPDYLPDDFFKKGDRHKFTVVKDGIYLYMQIAKHDAVKLCYWDLSVYDMLNEGRIGIRHMSTRSSRYSNFKVSLKK